MSAESEDDNDDLIPGEADEPESLHPPSEADELATAILGEAQVDVTQLYLNEIGQAPLLTADRGSRACRVAACRVTSRRGRP
jgi:RNA polymerase nonessential primary-like sigma factor